MWRGIHEIIWEFDDFAIREIILPVDIVSKFFIGMLILVRAWMFATRKEDI